MNEKTQIKVALKDIYTHTHTHTYVHTHTDTYINTHIHTYVRTYIHTYMHTQFICSVGKICFFTYDINLLSEVYN